MTVRYVTSTKSAKYEASVSRARDCWGDTVDLDESGSGPRPGWLALMAAS